MKYKGIELKAFRSDRPVIFEPPRKMLVWDDIDELDESLDDNDIIPVHAFLPRLCRPVITVHGYDFRHCAEIPENVRERRARATNRELTRWLAQGKGERRLEASEFIGKDYSYKENQGESPCPDFVTVRKWDDSDWHEPTPEYMWQE